MAIRKLPNDSDLRMAAGRSFQTDAAAWLKARPAVCFLAAGMLSRYCEDDRRFLVGALSLTDLSRYAGLPVDRTLYASVATL